MSAGPQGSLGPQQDDAANYLYEEQYYVSQGVFHSIYRDCSRCRARVRPYCSPPLVTGDTAGVEGSKTKGEELGALEASRRPT